MNIPKLCAFLGVANRQLFYFEKWTVLNTRKEGLINDKFETMYGSSLQESSNTSWDHQLSKHLMMSRRWDLPFNASKSYHLSIGGSADHHLILSKEAEGKLMTKCEQINDQDIKMNAAFTTSANVLTAANKARGLLYFIKRSFTCLTKEILLPLYSTFVRPHLEYAIQTNSPYLKKDIYHLGRI